MAFYKSPFLYITPLLITGIILSVFNLNIFVVLISLFVTFSLQFWAHFYLKSRLFYWATALSILLLGIGIGSFNSSEFRNDSLQGNQSFICIVKEFQNSTKNWKKGVVEIVKVKQNEAILPIRESMLLYFNSSVREGDLLLVNTKVLSIENKGNPGEFDAESYWKNKGITKFGFVGDNEFKWVGHSKVALLKSWVSGIRSSLAEHIDNYFEGDIRGIIKAILLGDKTDLSIESRNSFSKAGAMHVLAVSGLHVGIVMYLLLFVFSRFPRLFSRRLALVLTICIVWIYALITGLSPSVTRAALMFTILISGQVLSRQTNSINILFFSAFVMLLFDPNLLFDLGFQLSYLAVLGILLLHRPIVKMIYIPNKWLLKIWEGTAVGIAAQLATFPLILFHFHQFPNYFLLTNLVVMAIAGIILSVGLLFVLSKSITLLTAALSVLLSLVVNAFLFSIQFIETMPASVARGFELSALMVVILYLCLVAIYLVKNFKFKLLVGVVLIFILSTIQYSRYDRMIANHIVVFNHNEPLIAVKENDKLICLHSGDSSRITRVIQDYVKLFPGEVTYQVLSKDKKLVLNGLNHPISFKPIFGNLAIDLHHKKVLIKSSFQNLNSDEVIISMPYLPEASGEYNLSKGAFVLPL